MVRHRPIQGESNIDFLGESEGFFPPPRDSFSDAGEAINDFWSMSGNFIYRHHVEPRVKLCSPREESFRIPLKYIDVSRTTQTNLDVKQEKRIDDDWNIDGSRDLSDLWTGFTQFTLLEEKPPRRIYVVRGEINEKTAYIQARSFMARTLEDNGKNAKLKEKQKWSNEKLHLDDARRLRGIYFIDPEDKEFKETVKNARKKLETPVAPAVPAKFSRTIRIVGVVHSINLNQKNLRVSWKLVNIQDCVWENHYRLIMKTTLQEKDTIHYTITIWFTNLFLCLRL